MSKRLIPENKTASGSKIVEEVINKCKEDISQLVFIRSDVYSFNVFCGMTEEEFDEVADSLKKAEKVLRKYCNDLLKIKK